MIDAKQQKPPLIGNKDHSANVWGWDGHQLLIVAYTVDEDGWMWGNCYGNVFGEAEFDDDYDILYWEPIVIPEPPK